MSVFFKIFSLFAVLYNPMTLGSQALSTPAAPVQSQFTLERKIIQQPSLITYRVALKNNQSKATVIHENNFIPKMSADNKVALTWFGEGSTFMGKSESQEAMNTLHEIACQKYLGHASDKYSNNATSGDFDFNITDLVTDQAVVAKLTASLLVKKAAERKWCAIQ